MNLKLVDEEQKAFKQFSHLINSDDNCKAKNMILAHYYEYQKTKEELIVVFDEDELTYIDFVMNFLNKKAPKNKDVLISKIKTESNGIKWRINTNKLCKKIESLSSFAVYTLVIMSEELTNSKFEHFDEPLILNLN